MKVLWFSNGPSGSVRRIGISAFHGWMISLEDEIKSRNEIDLHVCFISNRKEDDFLYEGIHYYPVLRRRSTIGLKRVYERLMFSRGKDDSRVLPQLLDVVSKVKPDIIHIHGTEECFGLVQDFINDIPIVFSIQGLIAPCSLRYYSGYPEVIVRKYENAGNVWRGCSINRRYKDFLVRGKRELHYLSDAKYVIGRTSFDHLIPLLCNPKVRLFQGEEIMRPEFYLKKWDKKTFGEPLKLVSTISGGVYKGYETLLHTASLLKQFVDFDFEWNIIGYDCNSEWVHLAEKYKRISSVDSNIKFHGRRIASEMVEILTNCDIYVQVSHIENSPNCLCEAMLLGMPIIASFAGGTSSMLKDGEEGVLVQDGDPYVLGGAIVNLRQNFEKARNMGDKARKRALERHDSEAISEALIDTYKEIITIHQGYNEKKKNL